MDSELYEYLWRSSGRLFSFASRADGVVNKVVLFAPTELEDCYSLLLGDLRDDGSIDVDRRGGERNVEFVLATVASTIAFFLSDRPRAQVMITGTTPARLRLYRMTIGRELDAFKDYLEVYGSDGETVEMFEKGRAYQSFFVTRKIH